MTKKPKPFAICTSCEHSTDNPSLINQRCHLIFDKKGKRKRCKGIYRSMIAKGDWKECGDCLGTGIVDGNDCSMCRGSGWLCVRDRANC